MAEKLPPKNAFQMFQKGRGTKAVIEKFEIQQPVEPESIERTTLIRKFIEDSSEWIAGLENMSNFVKLCNRKEDEINFYQTHVELTADEYFDIYLRTRNQSKNFEWKALRQVRITSSKAYTLFTYVRNHNESEIRTKVEGYVFTEVRPTADMIFGSQNESVCIDIFEKRYAKRPVWKNCGLIINKNYPWFGYSPDAFVFEDEGISILEVKCPKLGKTSHGLAMCQKLPFLRVDKRTNIVTLRNKHMYYGQVQLGMALCNLKNAKLLIYVPSVEDVVVVNVPFDEQFAWNSQQSSSTYTLTTSYHC